MKRTIRTSCILLTVLLLLTVLFTGCGKVAEPAESTAQTSASSQEASTVEPLEEVKLVMYLVGDAYPDAGLVYTKVNKKLQADINATVEPKYLSWADWTTKYSLIFATGEDFDCIYTADWAFYADQATKKGFLELNAEMLQKSMPDYYALVPTDFWDQVKIDGKIFMIPYLNKQLMGHYMVLTRGDLRAKYSIPEIKTLADFDTYVTTVIKNETGMLGYDGDIAGLQNLIHNIYYKEPNNLMFLHMDPQMFTVALDNPTGKVNFTLDDPKYIDVLKKAKVMADAGYWSKNVLANKTLIGDNFKAGKAAFIDHQAESMISGYAETNVPHPEWLPEVTDLFPDKIHESSSAVRSGMAIHATSKNVERTLMMLDLFGTHKDYYDLTTYGIEGVHYTAIGDRNLVSLDAGLKLFPAKANCPWGWERKDYMRIPEGVPANIVNMESNWIANGVASTTPAVSFTFVDTNVKNEIAACDNLYKTKGYALIAGLLKDPEAEVAKLKADLKTAGIDKLQAEIQQQLTAYFDTLK